MCTGRGEKPMIMEENAIFILGRNKLQNELMASSLEKETSVKCIALDDYAEIESEHPPGENHLLLYDCMGKDLDDCMNQCAFLLEKNRRVLCLFNLNRGSGVEENLLKQGVRGFFYKEDTLQQLAKGAQAVLNGDLWISRKIMTDLIKRNNTNEKNVRQNVLSSREKDILAMIIEGATNEDIADKLCISKYTVKTHIYNIFKKIEVNNRFQAALWGVKHL
jgi:LuxR family transcriptional regulator, positive regulator of biofilm formation